MALLVVLFLGGMAAARLSLVFDKGGGFVRFGGVVAIEPDRAAEAWM